VPVWQSKQVLVLATSRPHCSAVQLSPDEHFAASLRVQADGGPLDFPAPVDLDIAFAAQGMVQEFSSLTAARQFAVEQLRALSYRLQEISEYIRSMQVPVLRDVNPSVHFSLVALLIAIIHWPDTGFCQALFNGFPAVGFVRLVVSGTPNLLNLFPWRMHLQEDRGTPRIC
jgi:hypothetical protein